MNCGIDSGWIWIGMAGGFHQRHQVGEMFNSLIGRITLIVFNQINLNYRGAVLQASSALSLFLDGGGGGGGELKKKWKCRSNFHETIEILTVAKNHPKKERKTDQISEKEKRAKATAAARPSDAIGPAQIGRRRAGTRFIRSHRFEEWLMRRSDHNSGNLNGPTHRPYSQNWAAPRSESRPPR